MCSNISHPNRFMDLLNVLNEKPEDLLEKAKKEENKNPLEAIRLYQQITDDPFAETKIKVSAMYQIAEVTYYKLKYKESKENFESALKLLDKILEIENPNSTFEIKESTYQLKAKFLGLMGKPLEALKCYTHISIGNPQFNRTDGSKKNSLKKVNEAQKKMMKNRPQPLQDPIESLRKPTLNNSITQNGIVKCKETQHCFEAILKNTGIFKEFQDPQF